MQIDDHIGIDCNVEYATEDLNNILSKFENLNIKKFHINIIPLYFLSKQDSSSIIKFIDMFDNINKFQKRTSMDIAYSLAGLIIYTLTLMKTYNKISVYKIMDHMLKKNMDTKVIYKSVGFAFDTIKKGIDCFHLGCYGHCENYKIVNYMAKNFNTIQNVRKIINNYDIILFDITNDLQIIESLLIISKYKHKIVPKFIITHKILYWYLFDKNKLYNI